MLLRSYLYAPGNRPDLCAKAAAGAADAVIVDLEDAVPAAERPAARRATAGFIAGGPARPVFVRINPGAEGLADLAALPARGLDGIRIAKAEDPAFIAAVDGALAAMEADAGLPAGVVGIQPIVESVAGLFAMEALAAASARIRRFAFGAGDFVRDIRGEATSERSETFLARSMVVLRSRALGLEAPIAHVYTPIRDLDGLRRASAADRALGFYGRSCIHPTQVAVINAAFDRTEAEIAHARAVVAAYDAAVREGRGSLTLADGTFIDEAVAKRAADVIALGAAQRTSPPA
ncbi:MAG: CoA ester lyase [Alphaproteobacteria bacterium]